ncbi:MAG: Uma2 family endonuclease [Pirellulaceae bacterium]
MLTRLGEHVKAIEHSDRACQLEPNDPFNFTAKSVTCQRAWAGTQDQKYIQMAEDAMAQRTRFKHGSSSTPSTTRPFPDSPAFVTITDRLLPAPLRRYWGFCGQITPGLSDQNKKFRIRTEKPIVLRNSSSTPEPDIAWVKRQSYAQRHPGPEDVLLIIEASVTSIAFDTGEKCDIYAKAGLPEYWQISVPRRQVRVYRSPRTGRFAR